VLTRTQKHRGSDEESLDALQQKHEGFVREAVRLRTKYESAIKLLIGIESEWIRDLSAALVRRMMHASPLQFVIGSVHHVHGIPIDFDHALYLAAQDRCGGSEDKLWEDFYDAQHDMLLRLQPRVVGHFDLIRLHGKQPDLDPQTKPTIWSRIVRNLELVRAQGALLEVNSSALRKKLAEPYPVRSICKVSFPGDRPC
jgi:histidinol-phosphatase (PHP family)